MDTGVYTRVSTELGGAVAVVAVTVLAGVEDVDGGGYGCACWWWGGG